MKRAKGVLIVLLTVFMCMGLTGTGIARGGNGSGQGGVNGQGGGNGQGNGSGLGQGNGTGICVSSQFASQDLVTIEGTVYSIGEFGQGISVDTDTEELGIVDVFGLGSYRYWAEQGMEKPEIGEDIILECKEITYSDDTTKMVAFAVTIVLEDEDDVTIYLRDDLTGLPLWRARGFGGGQRLQTGECPNL